jgi:peptidoglycan-associated lipoprotein
VASVLKIQGVSESQISIVSYGEEKPAAYGSDESAWEQNRRVEINY